MVDAEDYIVVIHSPSTLTADPAHPARSVEGPVQNNNRTRFRGVGRTEGGRASPLHQGEDSPAEIFTR
jgi:hypothetical protein